MIILIAATFVFIFLVVVLCVGFGRAFLASHQKQQIRHMLRRAETEPDKQRPDLLKTEVVQDSLSKLLAQTAALQRLHRMLQQSGLEWKVTNFLVITLVAAIAGSFAGFLLPGFSRSVVTAFIPGIVAGLIPLFILRRKR